MHRFLVACLLISCLAEVFCSVATPQDAKLLWPSGDAQIRGPSGGAEIVITTTNRLAGAIDSLTWNGKEFVDSHDHGRQIQSACSFDAKENKLMPLSDGPGEQSRPVVFSTPDGRYAMGICSPDQPSQGFEHAGYGRFRFASQSVVKWNCVFRVRNSAGIKPGNYTFHCYVVVGSIDNVRRSLERLDAPS